MHPQEESSVAPIVARIAALQQVAQEKGLIPADLEHAFSEKAHEHWVPQNGARLVARAWLDTDFKQRLLRDGRGAAREFGFELPEFHRQLTVLENTDDVHNVICCTLCSCTAFTIIGLPPSWYKDLEYRARVVREARTVLRELGLNLPECVNIRVWDTTADTRYMVLPLRPAFTMGWSEAQLQALVTQDSMIGVQRLEPPYAGAPA